MHNRDIFWGVWGGAGKAGSFLALDWNDDMLTGALSRRSFHLHARLATELPDETGYRRVQTLAVEACGFSGIEIMGH